MSTPTLDSANATNGSGLPADEVLMAKAEARALALLEASLVDTSRKEAASSERLARLLADDAGRDAFVLDHFNPNDKTKSGKSRVPEADSEGYSNRRIDRAADGKRFIQGNRLGRTSARWGQTSRLDDFREKGLKKRG